MNEAILTAADKCRFWSKVGPPDTGGCRLWTGGMDPEGYGRFYIATGRSSAQAFKAHRVAWFLATGEWPELCVLHECDTPLCVEIACLFEGTRADNIADMDAKGRRVNVCGEQRANAKLTVEDVERIRELRGVLPQRALAVQFGVCHTQIGRIQRNEKWKELVRV